MTSTVDGEKKGDKHVVIIGAGVGGAALAARLSHRGYRVTVVEKVSMPSLDNGNSGI